MESLVQVSGLRLFKLLVRLLGKNFCVLGQACSRFSLDFSCGLNENEGIVRPIPADQAQRRLALQGFIGCPKN